MRELLPSAIESDEALRAKIGFLREIVTEVGSERFIDAVKQAIRISGSRNEVTIKRIRECAGLSVMPPLSPAVQAWDLVTRIVRHHVRRDENDNPVLEDQVRLVNGKAVVDKVPEIPESVSRTVQLLGGWINLRESYLQGFWGAKFQQWKEVFRP